MELRSLDHVALWVANRAEIARAVTEETAMHVVDETERFTLLGADARRGKLTLFDAEGPREPHVLMHVALRVSGAAPDPLDLPDGLRLVFVEADTDLDYDLDHVALRARDPEAAARAYLPLGFRPAEPGTADARVEVGGAFVELHRAALEPAERPLLNHLGVLVDAAAPAQELGAEVLDVVDAPNTFAVFVRGPEDVTVEYVEHKPEFSLK